MKAQDNFEEGLDVLLGPETSIQAMGFFFFLSQKFITRCLDAVRA
jgi:hypothetical protein